MDISDFMAFFLFPLDFQFFSLLAVIDSFFQLSVGYVHKLWLNFKEI